MVDEVKSSAAVRKTSEVIARMKDVRESEEKNADVSHLICLLSDFQKSTSDFSDLRTDSTESIYLVPVAPKRGKCFTLTPVIFASPTCR
jgi:hypothetical protein